MSASVSSAVSNGSNMLSKLFGGSKRRKNNSQNRRKSSKKRSGKRMSMKKRRGGGCGSSTGVNAVLVAGEPNAQMPVAGTGNMLQYHTPNMASSLRPALVSGGKKKSKRKGGSVMDMTVPDPMVSNN